MLDNPNLNIEKMTEILAQGKEIIGISLIIVVVILLYIYRYEIGLFVKYGFSKNKKDVSSMGISQLMKTDSSELGKKDLNDRVENLLYKFSNSTLDEDDEVKTLTDIIDSSDPSINIPPNFRALKTIKNANEITCYFVNEGGAIQEFNTKSSDNIIIHFRPEKRIESNESGYIKFELLKDFDKIEFRFKLRYYDDANQFHQIKYLYSLLENKLSYYE